MEQIKDEVGERLTGTAPTWEDLWRAREYNGLATEEEARERSCNTPLQLGCGTPGGAEILIAMHDTSTTRPEHVHGTTATGVSFVAGRVVVVADKVS